MARPEGSAEAAGSPGQGQLLSILGLGFGLAGAVGGTIGAGILRTPGLVAAQLENPAWILGAWLVGGLYALLGAICVAELSASLPKAGGWYVYAERAFGPSAGFVVGWMDWIGHCAGLAWVAITIGDYSAALLPASLVAQLPGGGASIAVAALALFTLIQLPGVRSGSASQELLSLVKAAAFLVLVAACFLIPLPTPIAAPPPAAMPSAAAAVFALQAVITTLDGWASPIYFSEEFSAPERDLPRSLIGGVLAVVGLYLLINGALLHVLPLDQLASSTLPAADAARALVGPLGGRLITGLALVSLLGLINTVVMAAPRILYGLSRDGLFPAFGARVNAGGTPTLALLLTSLAAVALVLSGSFDQLLAMAAVIYVCLPLTGIAALLWLRQREPELPRPFLTWGYPLTPLVVAAVSVAFLVGALVSDTANGLAALALIAMGYPVCLVCRRGLPA
jgi:APA family basic amino acid/polyamine antiporter